MEEILEKLAYCVEFGKINQASPYPPDMRGQEGADELTKKALEMGVPPAQVLNKGLVVGMGKVGIKFRENKVFVPQVLMSAKAMSFGMMHLKPFFSDGSVVRKGKVIIGTVEGDLHDIGKNLVSMMVEGSGWEVIDLGTDVKAEKFVTSIKANPGAVVCLSALLTTTMVNMEKIGKAIKEAVPGTIVAVGGAPVTQNFSDKIGMDIYSADPQGLIEHLNKLN
jgi:methanogenic corrinoid protein MtbC1